MLSFSRIFSAIIHQNDSIVVAVSGGVDSMVLLDLVRKFHPRENIIVAHFDHSLRGSESDMDRDFVANFCYNNAIAFSTEKKDIAELAKESKGSIEAVARRERYAYLERIRRENSAKHILTAHHADDQAETIIQNLLKGGKLQGLSGMCILSGRIFRPLLEQTKEEILHYAHACAIPYREDSSNANTIFERNKIRHHVMPIFTELNPSVHKTFQNLAGFMQEIVAYFDYSTKNWLRMEAEKSGIPQTFLIRDFLAEHEFFQREIIAELYRYAHGDSNQGLSSRLITELIRFISEQNSFGIKDIGNLHLERRGERIYIL